jgi:hypothetical protein
MKLASSSRDRGSGGPTKYTHATVDASFSYASRNSQKVTEV